MARRPAISPFSVFGRQGERRIATVPPRVRTSTRTVRHIARQSQPVLERTVRRAVSETAKATSEAAVRRALEAGHVTAAADQVPWEQVGGPLLRAGHGAVFQHIFTEAGKVTSRTLGEPFEVMRPAALDFMRRRGGEFIQEFGGLSQGELQDALSRMLAEGLSVREAAALFKDALGLTTRQQQSLLAYRAELVLQGMGGRLLERAVERKAATWVRLRAETVARTEAQFAATAGEQAAWAQAVAHGRLDPITAQKEWLTSSAPCDICEPLSGTRVSLGRTWQLEDGRTIQGPPAHPNCLCTMLLYTGAEA